MAETSWANTNAAGIARADVRTPSVNLDAAMQTVREDGHIYNSLHNQAAPEHSVSPPAPPPKPEPTEPQLRELLSECIMARDFAAEQLQRATETSARAIVHREQCEIRLRDFADLDDRITAHTVAALRDNGRADLPDTLHEQLRTRDIARSDLAAATRAEAILSEALGQARIDAAAAIKAAKTAACALLARVATAKAERHDVLLAEAADIREQLAAFDRTVTGSLSTIPTPVLRVLRENNVNLARDRDRSQWVALLDVLLDDPQAALELKSVE